MYAIWVYEFLECEHILEDSDYSGAELPQIVTDALLSLEMECDRTSSMYILMESN